MENTESTIHINKPISREETFCGKQINSFDESKIVSCANDVPFERWDDICRDCLIKSSDANSDLRENLKGITNPEDFINTANRIAEEMKQNGRL